MMALSCFLLPRRFPEPRRGVQRVTAYAITSDVITPDRRGMVGIVVGLQPVRVSGHKPLAFSGETRNF
jgi:hypothetical protein